MRSAFRFNAILTLAVLFAGSGGAANAQAKSPADGALRQFPSLGLPIEQMKPISGGMGVALCEPATVPGTDEATAAFGAGCGRWLQFVVGGQAELGRTPLWEALNRAEKEMGRADLRLKPADVMRLKTMLGATHAATGNISGNASQCRLTYQLWQIDGLKPVSVGPPVTLNGSAAEVLQKLPGLAVTLSKLLGVTVPHIPASIGMNPEETALIGRLSLAPNLDLTDAQFTQVSAIAAHAPLAVMFLLNTSAVEDGQTLTALAQGSLKKAPANTLLYAQIAAQKTSALTGTQERFFALFKQFPANAPLAMAASRVYAAGQQAELAQQFAEKAVRAAYHSPDAWLLLAEAYKLEAQAVRQSRAFRSLSGPEQAYVNEAYHRWLQADLRAAQQDDQDAKAWLETAQSAVFASDFNLADAAFWNALRLDPQDPALYAWGLEMYQPKWDNSPDKLREVAEKAVSLPLSEPRAALPIVDALKASGFASLAAPLSAAILTRQEENVRARPNDVTALRAFGAACLRVNHNADALKAYQSVAALRPGDPRALFDLGNALQVNGQIPNALTAYQQAAALGPAYAEPRERIAALLLILRRNSEALAAYEDLVRISPRNELACEQLAALLLEAKRVPEAINAARRATQLNSNSFHAHELLGDACLLDRQFDASVIEYREALRLNPNNETLKRKLQDALNK